MSKKFTWVLPAHLFSGKEQEFEFDLTKYLQTLIDNNFWDRKIHYERLYPFTAESLAKIKSIKIKLFPYSHVQFRVKNHHEQVIQKYFGKVPRLFEYIIDRGNLRTAKSLAFVEIAFDSNIQLPKNYSRKKEFKPERYYEIDLEFHDLYLELISLSNEFISLFVTALHLTFPTRNGSTETLRPQTSGLVVFEDSINRYFDDRHSDILGHPILIEPEKFDQLNTALELISSIWHKNLWSLHRFLKALRSDFIEIDHLLDLVFTLESLFPKDASSESVRIASCIIIAKNLSEASDIENTLRVAFNIRNEVAHGGVYYRITDHYKYKKDKVFIYSLFWKLKEIVASLLVYALVKLREKGFKDQDCLRINSDDLFHEYFGAKVLADRFLRQVKKAAQKE